MSTPKSEQDVKSLTSCNMTDNTLITVPESKDDSESKTSEATFVPDEEKNSDISQIEQSPDIALSMQNTLRYSDVEADSDAHDDDSSQGDSSDSSEAFEDAPATHEQPQFKNSFYEKLSVTCQNLESTVASLQKPGKDDEVIDEQNATETIPEVTQDCCIVSRPETLSLSHPVNVDDKHKKDLEKSSHISKHMENLSLQSQAMHDNSSALLENQGAYYIEPSGLSPKIPQGTVRRKGDMIEFVADNLEQMIKQSSPLTHTESTESPDSRRSSVRSIASASSSTSFATSSGVSRSPSSLLQQSPDDIPPIDASAVLELESHARRVADSVDLMMGNIRNNLHKMSAITIGCQDAYKRSVDITCDSVDGSIKVMYTLMAKCEELSMTMGPVQQLATQIKEIKRILDLFELQLAEKS